MSRWRPILCVLVPFAAGYYLSYLFRSINAVIADDLRARPELNTAVGCYQAQPLHHTGQHRDSLVPGQALTTELGLSAADLGLLTSIYFLVFAAAMLPCGVLLDRYGPRLVDSALLLVAAAGSLVFAIADGIWSLMLGRMLIGLGVTVGLIAGLKAILMWFPPERVALANGWYIMLGALGALSATGPAELVVQSVGWRGLFAVVAVASAAVALPHSPRRAREEAGPGCRFRTQG